MRSPHIFTRRSRVRPKEILITSAKRLFQQHRSKLKSLTNARMSAFTGCGHAVAYALGGFVPKTAVSNCSKPHSYSITSSAMASSIGGISGPSAPARSCDDHQFQFDGLHHEHVIGPVPFTRPALGARHERHRTLCQLVHVNVSIRLDVVFARDRTPQ